MRINKLLLAMSIAVCSFAHAEVNFSQIQLSAGEFSPAPVNAVVVFDTVLPEGIHYNGGRIVSGTAGNAEFTAPSEQSGLYLAVGNVAPTAVVSFDSDLGASYFGFYLGTPDSYNSVTFNGSDGSKTTIDGNALGYYSSISTGGAYYLGVYSTAGTHFTSIVFQSDGDSMETDNHSFILAPVPEPETYAMLLGGLALIGLASRRRRG